MIKNTYESYGSLSKTLHWLNAILIIGMLIFGFILGLLDENPSLQITLISFHKSLGLTILLLILIQFGWSLINVKPALPLTIPLWQQTTAKIVHFCLYLAVFTMVISGWLMSSLTGKKVLFWGWIDVTLPFKTNRALADKIFDIHGYTAWIIIGLLVLHVGAALKHHFWDKNYVLRRMLPGIKNYCLKD